MAKLPRPHIPLNVRCIIAMRQLGETCEVRDRSWSRLLADLLFRLSSKLGCEPKELRLDHDPPLAVRKIVYSMTGQFVRYIPDANDPDHLIYRTAHNHHIKTNVRGDGAQFPDRVLIKRERRRRKGSTKKPGAKIKSRPLKSSNRWPPRGSRKINWKKR